MLTSPRSSPPLPHPLPGARGSEDAAHLWPAARGGAADLLPALAEQEPGRGGRRMRKKAWTGLSSRQQLGQKGLFDI